MENVMMNRMLDSMYRYELDFIKIPLLIYRAKQEVIDLILNGSYLALASLYNTGWPGGKTKRFTGDDFKCRRIQVGTKTMIYITLPPTDIRAPMACTHLAITFRQSPSGYKNIRAFNIERGGRDTTAIGEMKFSPDGERLAHCNYGSASKSDDENIGRIWEIAFGVPYEFGDKTVTVPHTTTTKGAADYHVQTQRIHDGPGIHGFYARWK